MRDDVATTGQKASVEIPSNMFIVVSCYAMQVGKLEREHVCTVGFQQLQESLVWQSWQLTRQPQQQNLTCLRFCLFLFNASEPMSRTVEHRVGSVSAINVGSVPNGLTENHHHPFDELHCIAYNTYLHRLVHAPAACLPHMSNQMLGAMGISYRSVGRDLRLHAEPDARRRPTPFTFYEVGVTCMMAETCWRVV